MRDDSSTAPQAPAPFWIDTLAVVLLCGLVFAVLTVTREWISPLQAVPVIHLEASYLPLYTLLSLSRGFLAYGVSVVFTLVYGYIMARVGGAERFLLPLLDVLQSIPVLGFLPGFVLGLVHLSPSRNIGLEIASVLMIFTGQVWNMTFSFYSSLKSVPPDLKAVARLSRMSWWRRFFTLDLSFAAKGLLWNSMMSMAGGWFFLMVSEAFVLGEKDFRLPGLGSYMSVAIDKGDSRAQWLGVLSMLAMIVAVDRVVWRPLVAWSHKFTDEETVAPSGSRFWRGIRRARIWQAVSVSINCLSRCFRGVGFSPTLPRKVELSRPSSVRRWIKAAQWGGTALLLGGLAWALFQYGALLMRLGPREWFALFRATFTTFLRVFTAVVIASLWTVPAGVFIGRNPRWAKTLQPIIQMAASFPAPMIFPIVVGTLLSWGIGLGTSSIALLLLGTQWYILFNVISGSSSIPAELWEVSLLSRFSLWQRWRRLILPAIFPSLLTGWITAAGGAWNASIVAEYMKVQGKTLSTVGLGAAISDATELGDYPRLGAAVGIMALSVGVFNHLCWRPLGRLAQNRYTLDS